MISGSEAVARTHEWFERNSGWAPPDPGSLAEWLADGLCRCPDECIVAPGAPCEHGLASWWLVLVALDQPTGARSMPVGRLVPHPGRLDPTRADYVPVMEAHHRAVMAGEAGYLDPGTGLFAQTAQALWDRGSCCEQGCRHCPYVGR